MSTRKARRTRTSLVIGQQSDNLSTGETFVVELTDDKRWTHRLVEHGEDGFITYIAEGNKTEIQDVIESRHNQFVKIV